MKKLVLFAGVCALLCLSGAAQAQEFDVAAGVSTVSSKSATINSSGLYVPDAGGGAYPVFSGDFLFFHSFGVGGEVTWRASQGIYAGFQPYRPILYDFNGVFAPKIGRIQPEVQAGIGAESLRFYQQYFNCNFTGCTNYTTSSHFMGHIGGGLRFYVWHHVFVRPEAHVYLVHNNVEFSSGNLYRYGVSIGYALGAQ